ncbi:hypothetical protein CDAR_432841 [Caerostris darwini]|uniref:Uncharacterized protein n=1 Tax=Caerostris darwini TaxID=1538125 RepID=A0AAV4QK23_9ARAC|nr:hypothetical protein CDAR_432841 [Caerostris darwini]
MHQADRKRFPAFHSNSGARCIIQTGADLHFPPQIKLQSHFSNGRPLPPRSQKYGVLTRHLAFSQPEAINLDIRQSTILVLCFRMQGWPLETWRSL